MPPKKTRLLPKNKKAASTAFKPSLSAHGGIYDKESTLTKQVTLYQGVGTSKTTRVEDSTYYVQWELLGVPHTIETIPGDFEAKEIITLNDKPKSNILEFACTSNLDIENLENTKGDTLNWIKPDGTPWAMFDRIMITDSKNIVHWGKYLAPETGKNFGVEMPDIPPENYPVEVDPTVLVTSFITLGNRPFGFGLGVNNGTGVTLFLVGGNNGFEIWYTEDTTDWSGGDETSDSNFAQADVVKVGQALLLSTGDTILIGSDNSIGSFPVVCERISTDRTYNGRVVVTGLSNGSNGSPHAIRDDADDIYILGPASQFALAFSVSYDLGDSFSSLNAPSFFYNAANTRDKIQLLDLGLTILAVVRDWQNGSNGDLYEATFTKSTGLWDGAGQHIPPSSNDVIEGQARIRLIQVENGDVYLYYRSDAGLDVLLKKSSGTWSTISQSGTDLNGEAFVTLAANNVIVLADSTGTGIIKTYDTVGDTWDENTEFSTIPMVAGRNYTNVVNEGGPLFFIGTDGSGSYYMESTLSAPSDVDTDPPTGGDITAPANGATNVSIMPTVTVAGWEDATTPLSGQVQIDTVASFDSANLQTSAWKVLSDAGGDIWGGDFSSWSALDTNTLYYMQTRARDAVEPPNVSDWTAAKSFTTGGWIYLGMDQPSIVYGGSPETTVYFPIPIRVIATKFSSGNKINQALDKSVEVVGRSYPTELKIIMTPVVDAAFDAAMVTFYEDWGGQRLWFDFTSGVDTRYDGYWLLKLGEWRPRPSGGYKKYDFTLERPNNNG